jgi:hypothetical protein
LVRIKLFAAVSVGKFSKNKFIYWLHKCYILQEIKCLQNKYKDLEDKCKKAIQTFTKMTISNPTLDFLLMKSCEPMIPLFCSVNLSRLISLHIKFFYRMLKMEMKMSYFVV